MKKIALLVGLSLLLLSFNACNEEETLAGGNELPTNSKTFLADYFSDEAIVSIEQGTDNYQVYYPSYKVQFDKQGEWKQLDGKRVPGYYKSVPNAFINREIPQAIRDWVATNYPNAYIVDIEREYKNRVFIGYEIELSNGIDDLFFDTKGNFVSGPAPNVSALPQSARTFLTTYFADDALISQKRDDGDYEVTLTSGIEIEFNSQGVWKNVDGNFDGGRYSALPTSFLNVELPGNLLTFVNANYPGRVIIEVEKEFKYNSLAGYEIYLNGKIELKFDINGSVTGGGGNSGTTELPQTAKDFMNTHFSGSSYTTKLDDGEYKVYAGNYKLEFDRQGNWIQIDGETGNRKTALPASILALQPVNTINAYVNSRYAGRYIIKIEKDYEKGVMYYEVELNNSVDLIFDAQGKFLKRD